MFTATLARPSTCLVPVPKRLGTTKRAFARPSLVRRAMDNNESFSHSTESSEIKTDVAVGIGGFTRTGGEDVMDQARVVDPYGLIQDVMTSPVSTLTPGLELDDPIVRETLERYHGVPVVSVETGVVTGVLSRSDLLTLNGETQSRTVGETMSSPPICVRPKAHVAEAAGMMLQHKVHRLPVVDDRNVPIGVATRMDVFEPLIAKRDDMIVDQQTRRYLSNDERDEGAEDIEASSHTYSPHLHHSLKSSSTPHRIRVAAKPATKPFIARRDAPLTALSSNPRDASPSAGYADTGETEEVERQARMRKKKLVEGFEEGKELDVDAE